MNHSTASTHTLARQLTRKRVLTLSIAFLLFLIYLFLNLFNIQVLQALRYRQKVYEQITTESRLRARRGRIYDANMNLLATDRTVWRIFASPRAIHAQEQTQPGCTVSVARELAALLSLDEERLYSQLSNTRVLDVTVKRTAEEAEYRQLLALLQQRGWEELIFTEAQSSRYYPGGSMAAHLLGFVGSDSQGLYGLEYQYDDILSGRDGSYLYARDAAGNALPGEYATYLPPEDGCSLVTTLDSYLQQQLESQVEAARQNHGVENRVTGIVMNVATGAILAMATSSPFDPNDPYELDAVSAARLLASGLTEGSEEYRAYKKELLQIMWSNKAVSEIYEPGSTFKIITVASALEAGVVSMNDIFSCSGALNVGGYRIRCHKAGGHGSGFSLAYGLQMSCNPTMMTVAARLGADTFYQFVESFGYFEKTGIDLPSEGTTVFHKRENIGATELATLSFGQRFKVSILSQLTAIAAVANGGELVTPYVVERIIDADGSTVTQHRTSVRRRVISEQVAEQISRVLEEGVSGEGGAKNARVDGYAIAAKTGTSQKFDVLDANGNSYLRIGSTVAYAPVGEEEGIAMIFVVDEPTSSVKYGSTVAAPYVAAFMEKALPYLGHLSSASESTLTVGNYCGLNTAEATRSLRQQSIAYQLLGDGDTVLRQFPAPGELLYADSARIILVTEESAALYTEVPELVGLSAPQANALLLQHGLNLRLLGIQSTAGGARIVSQSLPPGTVVARGSCITLTLLYTDEED